MLHKHSDYEDQKRNSQIQPTKLSPTRAALSAVLVSCLGPRPACGRLASVGRYQVRPVRNIIARYGPEGGVYEHKYEIIIYWSNQDQVFIAVVPELPGCMAHGSTPEAALAYARSH